MREKLSAWIRLMRLDRPVGIWLVLWPALWALWLGAGGMPDGWILFVFIAGAVLMRSAGCVINDYADRHFDPHVKRTCTRPLACGEVSPKEALVLFVALCLLAFTLVLTLNRATVLWSLGAVALAALYPFTKRWTYWPQAFLGAAFAWAVPMGFAATTGSVPAAAWALYAAVLIWALVYDGYYAMVDREDDARIGVKSPAVLLPDKLCRHQHQRHIVRPAQPEQNAGPHQQHQHHPLQHASQPQHPVSAQTAAASWGRAAPSP